MLSPCTLKEMPARPVLSIRTHSPVEGLPKLIGQSYGEIMYHLSKLGAAPAGMPFVAYHSLDLQNLDVEIGFPVASRLPGNGDVRPGEMPAGKYVTVLYTGPYPEMAPAYEELARYAQSQGLTPSGVSYEVYLNGPDQVSPEGLQTEIWFPVA